MPRTHNGGVVAFKLRDAYIEVFMSRRELADFIAFLIGIGRKIKAMGRPSPWHYTIATISIENILLSPECYDEVTRLWDSCSWHWSTYYFIKRYLENKR